jgi:hypothetical protein
VVFVYLRSPIKNMYPSTSKYKTFRSLISLILFTCAAPLAAQVNGDYKAVASGNWSTLTSWQRWNGTAWVTPTLAQGSPTSVNATITLQSGFLVNLDVNVTVDQLVISGTLSIPSAITLTTAAGTGTDIIITSTGILNNAGNLSLTTNTTTTNTGSLHNSGTVTINTHATLVALTSTGTITNAGTINVNVLLAGHVNALVVNSPGLVSNNSGIISTTGYALFSTGSKYQHNFPAATADAGSIIKATWNPGSTCEILACGNSGSAPSNLTQGFKNFIWNYTDQPIDINLSGPFSSTLTNFTLQSTSTYKLILKSTSGFSTSVSGSLTLNGGNIDILNNTTSFAGNNLLSVGSYTQTAGVCNVNSSGGNASGSNGNSELLVSGTMNISGGTLNINNSAWAGPAGGLGTLTVSGTLTLSGTGIINVCSSASTGSVGNGIVNASILTITGGTLNLCSSTSTGGGGQGILNVSGDFTHSGGVISKTSALNTGTINITGSTGIQKIESIGFTTGQNINFNIIQSSLGTCNIAITKTFVLNQGTIFTINPNIGIADLTVDGTLTANTNTWYCTPGSVTNFSGTGKFINNSTSSITTNSSATSLTFSAASIFISNGDGGEVATATWASTSVVQVNGIVSATTLGNGGQSFGQIYWSCASQIASTDFGAAGFSTKSSYTIASTGTGKLRFPDIDFTIGSTSVASNMLIISGSSVLQISNNTNLYATGNRTITINGHVDMSGTSSMIIGSPNSSGTGVSGSDQSKDFALLLKRNFVFSSGTPSLISFHHCSYAIGDESYRLIFNFCGGLAQTLNIPAVASNIIAVSASEFISNNIYKLLINATNTNVTPAVSLKTKMLQVDAGATFTLSATTLNLSLYPLLTASGSIDNGSVVINAISSVSLGTLDMGLSTVTDATGSGAFTLNSFAKIKTKHLLGLTASAAAGSIQVTGTRTYHSNAYYVYNNTTGLPLTGDGLPSTLTNTLEIASGNPSATIGVTLTQPTAITTSTGRLLLTLGRLITTSANLITLDANALVSPVGGAATKFVDGPIQKTGGTLFIFPTGDVVGAVAKWSRLAISAPSAATDAFTAEYKYVNPHTAIGSVYGTGITDISYREYWNLTRTTGSSTPLVTLYWENGATTAGGSGILSISPADLHIAEWYDNSGFKWNDLSGTITGSTSIGTIATLTTPTFVTGTVMPFTLMGPTPNNPLPIELIEFSVNKASDRNNISWTTASETNNDYFELFQSNDGQNFKNIAAVDGNGNSSSSINYNHTELDPKPAINYYQLKQVDFDGKATYSSIISVDNSISEDAWVFAYPNPTNGSDITLNVSDNIIQITVYNLLGELIYYSENISGNRASIGLTTNGVYLVKAISADNKVITSRITKK